MSLGYYGPRYLLPFALRISSATQMTGRSDDPWQCRDSHHIDCDRIRSPTSRMERIPCTGADTAHRLIMGVHGSAVFGVSPNAADELV